MEDISLSIKNIKNGNKEHFIYVIKQFRPLIKKYTKLLYKDDSITCCFILWRNLNFKKIFHFLFVF